jgi:hypothetical protein
VLVLDDIESNNYPQLAAGRVLMGNPKAASIPFGRDGVNTPIVKCVVFLLLSLRSDEANSRAGLLSLCHGAAFFAIESTCFKFILTLRNLQMLHDGHKSG